jgi:diamine N-acetyltransferase
VGAARVKTCTPEDSSLIAEIGARTFRETYVADTPAGEMERHLASAYDREAIAEELGRADSTFFLATVDGAPAGYIKLNRGAAQTDLREQGGLEIESLYVLRAYQGSRIGQLLLDCALAEARKAAADHVWLGVWERNLRARSFWRNQGFVEFGSHPFQFGEVQHTDLLFRRSI